MPLLQKSQQVVQQQRFPVLFVRSYGTRGRTVVSSWPRENPDVNNLHSLFTPNFRNGSSVRTAGFSSERHIWIYLKKGIKAGGTGVSCVLVAVAPLGFFLETGASGVLLQKSVSKSKRKNKPLFQSYRHRLQHFLVTRQHLGMISIWTELRTQSNHWGSGSIFV